MKFKNISDKLIFIGDSNDKYVNILKDKINKEKDKNKKSDYNLAKVSGKYIFDMISCVCDCGIEYSVTSNCLMWYCPVCEKVCSFNKIMKIDNETFNVGMYNIKC